MKHINDRMAQPPAPPRLSLLMTFWLPLVIGIGIALSTVAVVGSAHAEICLHGPCFRHLTPEEIKANNDENMNKMWSRMEKPSPASTLAPIEDRSHGNYRNLATSGNGCGGFGVVAIDEIEKAAVTNEFRSQLESRMQTLQQQYEFSYLPYDMRDIFMPEMGKVDEKVIRTCLPNLSKLVESIIARRDEAEKKAAAAEAERRSPHGQVIEGYELYRLVRYCNEVRRGYLVKYVNDDELDLAMTSIKAIVKKAKANEPGINTDELWNKAMGLIANRPIGAGICQNDLRQLLRMSPVPLYDNTKPAE